MRWLSSSAEGSREVAAIQSIRTSRSLWDVARGRDFEATIDRPTILGATDRDGDACILKVLQVLSPLFPGLPREVMLLQQLSLVVAIQKQTQCLAS